MKFEVTEKHFVKVDNEYCGENDDTCCEYNYGTPSHYCKKFRKGLVTYFISNRDSGRQLRCDECKKLFSNAEENTTVNKWEVFQKAYDESIEHIRFYLEDKTAETHEWELEFKHLIKWLFETEHNPYGIFGTKTNIGGAVSYAEGFAGLAATIHHAICDDGDICYPVIDGRPSIYFGWQYDEDIEAKLIHEDVFQVELRKKFDIYEPPTLTFLKNAYEFTKAFDDYEELQSKRYEELENRRWENEERRKNEI